MALLETNKIAPAQIPSPNAVSPTTQPTQSRLPPTEWPRAHSDRLLAMRCLFRSFAANILPSMGFCLGREQAIDFGAKCLKVFPLLRL